MLKSVLIAGVVVALCCVVVNGAANETATDTEGDETATNNTGTNGGNMTGNGGSTPKPEGVTGM